MYGPVRAVATAVAALSGAACVVGAPHGFSDGDQWTFPLVNPLEDGVLLAPVYIHDSGPYLFMIDPDSPMSAIDEGIASELSLYGGFDVEQIDENDNSVPVRVAEVRKLAVGNLTVSNRWVRVHAVNTFWVDGRRVRGILGRSVIADSLVFAVDRDRGLAHLATQGKLAAPAGAVPIEYRNFICEGCFRPLAKESLESTTVVRRLVRASINNQHPVTVHLDLGARTSMLWPGKLKAFNMPRLGVAADLVDELGSSREVRSGSIAAKVTVGGVEASGIMILPYGDKRFREVELDGALGQNLFADYHVTVNWHQNTFWLARRDPADLHGRIEERLGRWGATEFASCSGLACVTIAVVNEDAGAAAARRPAGPGATTPDAATPGASAPDAGDAADATATDAAATGAVAPGSGDAQSPDAPAAAPQPSPAAAPGALPRYALHITREPPAVGKSYEILFEAVDARGQPLGLPRLKATLNSGVAVVRDAGIDARYAGAAGFRVLDMSPFVRPCGPGTPSPRCVWEAPVKR